MRFGAHELRTARPVRTSGVRAAGIRADVHGAGQQEVWRAKTEKVCSSTLVEERDAGIY